jgi:hypothetical protein
MSINKLKSLSLANKHSGVNFPTPSRPDTTTVWTRPLDWLSLPTITTSDQKFAGLYMVTPDSCFCALSAAGAYTVDWGDGNIIDYATGVTAQHQYDYTNVTLGAVTTEGWKQALIVITPQAGQYLTSLNLHKKHSLVTTVAVLYTSGFVDIAVASSVLSSFLVSVPSTNKKR